MLLSANIRFLKISDRHPGRPFQPENVRHAIIHNRTHFSRKNVRHTINVRAFAVKETISVGHALSVWKCPPALIFEWFLQTICRAASVIAVRVGCDLCVGPKKYYVMLLQAHWHWSSRTFSVNTATFWSAYWPSSELELLSIMTSRRVYMPGGHRRTLLDGRADIVSSFL